MKKIKNYWNTFFGKILKKLLSLFTKFYKNWELKRKEENFKEGTKRMLEIVDYMENRSKNKFYEDNAKARIAVNESDKRLKLSNKFHELRLKIIESESTSRDNVEDVIVDKFLESVKTLPSPNTDLVMNLTDANPDMMTNTKFIELLEKIKAQNVIEEKKPITINYES